MRVYCYGADGDARLVWTVCDWVREVGWKTSRTRLTRRGMYGSAAGDITLWVSIGGRVMGGDGWDAGLVVASSRSPQNARLCRSA
jgi:hypothetical protein